MSHCSPMFACGPVFTPAETAVIMCVFVAWVVAGVLSLVNLVFILLARTRRAFALKQGAILLSCVGLAALLYAIAFGNVQGGFNVALALIFLIPMMVIGQFIYLLVDRRRAKRVGGGDRQAAKAPSAANPTC